MDDVIYRQDVLDALDITPLEVHDYELAVGVIKDIPSAQQWIPCSERLPEEGISVLGTFEGESGNFVLNHITARLVIDGKDVWCSGQGLSAIAWMPLPEPYKGESNG